jgi:hypothetical protein
VDKKDYQLVGVAAMWIASKYQEIYAPECKDFTYVCDGLYTDEQVLSMEMKILRVLQFDLTVPSALSFLAPALGECQLKTKYFA